MRIFDSDFVVTEGSSCPTARTPLVRLDTSPNVHVYKLAKKNSDREVFRNLNHIGVVEALYFFTLEEFNALLSEEIELFNKKEDGKINLYSHSGSFPYFNFYVRDEGVEYVVELSLLPDALLFDDNHPDWMVNYHIVHDASWTAGTYVVVKEKGSA